MCLFNDTAAPEIYTLSHNAALPIYFDLYRLETPEAVYELGFEDALDEGVSLIEWSGRLGPLRPADRLDVTLSQGATRDARKAHLEGHGGWRERLAAIADD